MITLVVVIASFCVISSILVPDALVVTESETYSINEGWGFQMSFMIPLGTNNETCSELAKVKLDLAKEELDKQVHDKQLVRILKCGQLHASGYMINPASKYAYICSDVINIRTYVKTNPEKFK